MNLTALEPDHLVQNNPLSLDVSIKRFIASIDAKMNSKSTYKRQIKPFIEWITEKYSVNSLRSLEQQDIYSYKNFLIKSGKSFYTISGYLTALRKFFAWLESQEIFPNIARSVKDLKKPKDFRKECLTTDQIKSALEVFDTLTVEGLRDFFNFLVRTGLITVEISRATVGDLYQESGKAILLVQGKGCDSKDDFVLLVEETLRPLFCSISNRTRGESLKECTISGIIKDALRKIDVDDSRITAHPIRHTAVSLSIKNGASLIQAQAMARHSDPKTNMIYFHNHERIKSGAERYVII